MARRIGFYEDPTAPSANSLVPSVSVVVANAVGDVLLIRRAGTQIWAVPGGAGPNTGIACRGADSGRWRIRRPDE